MSFTPDHHHLLDVVANRRPARLPLYEHNISPGFMERVMGESFAALHGDDARLDAYFEPFCRFWREQTYDTVSYEVCITPCLPGHGALVGGRPGPIQSRADYDAYPWDSLVERYWQVAAPRFAALGRNLPAGMRAVGGVGNGVFECAEDLIGYEWLSVMIYDDPELVGDVFKRIGALMTRLWERFLRDYGELYCAARFGDDLGFKTSTLLKPAHIRRFVVPEYRRVIGGIKAQGKPFIFHSCGCIFSVMDDCLTCGIDAKHSNEDAIAPYDRWIADYGGRIGLLGGVDVDLLCRLDPAALRARVRDDARRWRSSARGWALGSGNSIPDYVPVDAYLAMVQAAQDLRAEEVGAQGLSRAG